MNDQLSDWASEFLQENRIAIISTIEKDGSPHITGIWYFRQGDGTIIMNTPAQTYKLKNLRRDPRIAICVADGARSVSLYGTARLITDSQVIRRDLEILVERYVRDETERNQSLSIFTGQNRVSIHVKPVKVTEFNSELSH